METKFSEIASHEAVQSVVSDSFDHPVIVFKHSNSCSISNAAFREMQKLNAEVRMVDVNTARNISQELAHVTGVAHESPQVIIVRNGSAVWDASHFDVQAEDVQHALEANS